jgi:PAS domain S-box-containing protein
LPGRHRATGAPRQESARSPIDAGGNHQAFRSRGVCRLTEPVPAPGNFASLRVRSVAGSDTNEQAVNSTHEAAPAGSGRNEPERNASDGVAHFRALVDSSPDAILVFVLDRCLYANRAATRLLGAPQANAVAELPLLDAIDPEHREMLREKLRAVARHEAVAAVECRCARLDGTTIDVELSISPVEWLGARAVQVHARDITETKRLERQSQERQDRLDAVLRTAADAIIVIDARGVIGNVNAAAERLFGYSAGEMTGQNVKALMPSPFGDEHESYLARYQKTREPRIIGSGREVIAKRSDGTTFPASLSVSEIDHLNLFTGIVRDISAEKELQRHVLDIAAQEQRRIGQELHDGTQQELTGLALFSGTVLDVLSRAEATDTADVGARRITAADFALLDRAARRLAQGLDEASRHVRDLAHGIMPVQIDAEGLQVALKKLAASVSRERRIVCLFESSASVRIADNTVATHLYRIAQEAVNNAARHARASRISISLSETDRQIVLEIADNGIGLESGASDRARAGMGMKIMQYRAGILGGGIRVSGGREAGTTIACVVPRR